MRPLERPRRPAFVYPVDGMLRRMARGRWFALPAFVLATLAALAVWWWQGRTVDVPDAPAAKVPCLSYAPFRDGQTPFDPSLVIPPAQIEEDLRALASHTSCIRTYATEQGLAEVPRLAKAAGLKVLLGAWIGSDPARNQQELATVIDLANRYPETVEAVIVGNEVLLRREQPAERLAVMIDRVRDAVPVPVTYADVWEFWVQNKDLAEHVDFVTIHTLPYWEDHPIAVGQAIDHVVATWRRMRDLFAGKPVMIGEAGWPSAGRMREGALPSPVNQARFVRGLLTAAERDGFRVNLIEAFDQPWKRQLEGTVGGNWGLFSTDRAAKFNLRGPVARDPLWPWRFAIASALAGIAMAVAVAAKPFKPLTWLALAFGVQLVAGTLVFAASELLVVSRTLVDWAVGMIQLSAATVLPVLVLTHFLNATDPPHPLRAIPAAVILNVVRTRKWVEASTASITYTVARLIVLIGATATTLALAFDPRYRDFPIALYAVPAIVLLGAAWRGWRTSDRSTDRRTDGREERLLGWFLLAGGIAVLAREGLENIQAVGWWAITMCLALSVLVGGFGLTHVSPRLQPHSADRAQD